MTPFQCIPIPTDVAERFRRSLIDDSGNALRSIEATEHGSFPCRHCLAFAKPGERMLLGSYNLPQPQGIYWTPSPIFIHERPCLRFTAENAVAPIIGQGALISIRAYDSADQCIYDLGHVCAGAAMDAPLDQALSDPRTAFVNIHTARPGCMLARIEARPHR